VLFDWYFLPPYGTLTVRNPLDWLVLAAFLFTSGVATQLLDRARREAESARLRASDVDRLATLGAETLNVGRPEDALVAVADVIRTRVVLDHCAVHSDGTVYGSDPPVANAGLVAWVLEQGMDVAVLSDGTTHAAATRDRPVLDDVLTPGLRIVSLLRPLLVRDRVVGVLVANRADGLELDAPRRGILDALGFYAALGVERVRLDAEARHAAALRAADQLKDAVLASVSHDLRTPLTTIKALAHELAADAAADDDRAMTIEEEADRLNRFVGDLLDLSRAQAGVQGGAQAGGPPARPDLNEAEDVVGVALRQAAGALGSHEVAVSFDPEYPVLIGRFDFRDTLRALVNLLENAAKYAPPATPISLEVRRAGASIAFRVADRGPGVAPAEAERIFVPFYRPPGTAPDVGGAGLGLSIARSLAVSQGGALTYAPRPGGGSLFTLSVPAAESTES
jgi:two-component system sensor histidine kinase KdpD